MTATLLETQMVRCCSFGNALLLLMGLSVLHNILVWVPGNTLHLRGSNLVVFEAFTCVETRGVSLPCSLLPIPLH